MVLVAKVREVKFDKHSGMTEEWGTFQAGRNLRLSVLRVCEI